MSRAGSIFGHAMIIVSSWKTLIRRICFVDDRLRLHEIQNVVTTATANNLKKIFWNKCLNMWSVESGVEWSGVIVSLRKDLSCAETEIRSDSACRVGRAAECGVV